ncbi:sensor histidine kinase [Bacillus sp. DJP31]|uniref:sensor histidine kinase n=1 Tax=Bacillus sp. DJP31 TaxID=3409789 RepID=UPI003BB6E5B3
MVVVRVKTHQWMWMDWLIFTFRCSWYGTGLMYYYVNPENLGGLSYLEFVFFVLLGLIIPFIFWRPGYIHPTGYAIAELMVTGGFSVYIHIILGIHLNTSIILMPVLMIGYLMTKSTAPWTIPLFVILIPASRYWTIDNLFNFFLQYTDILLFFGIGLGFNLITKSQKRYKNLLTENMKQNELITQQNKTLEQYAAKVEKLALVEERNRMARDLHDSIGHHFTSVTVGLDAISYMIETHPKLAAEKVNKLADISREGLTEVRRTIHQIAPAEDDLPLSIQLEQLTKEFGEHTSTDINFNIEGKEPELASHIKLTFVRCLQECMTNAKRHGEARSISVSIRFTEEYIELKVYNNGRRMDAGKYGFGLISMKNRLEERNGTLQIENDEVEEGITIVCTVPVGGKA